MWFGTPTCRFLRICPNSAKWSPKGDPKKVPLLLFGRSGALLIIVVSSRRNHHFGGVGDPWNHLFPEKDTKEKETFFREAL